MREQRKTLKDVSHVALRYREIGVLRCIKHDALANGDPHRIRLGQSGDAVEQSVLPCSGGAKQDCEPRRGAEIDVQNKFVRLRYDPLAESRFEPWTRSFPIRGWNRSDGGLGDVRLVHRGLF